MDHVPSRAHYNHLEFSLYQVYCQLINSKNEFMISLVMFLAFLLFTAFWIVRKRKDIFKTETHEKYGEQEEYTVLNTGILTKMIIFFVLGIILSIFQPFVYERVDAGYVGVKVNLTGHSRGISDVEYTTGWVMYNSWFEELYQYPTYQQHVEYEKEQVILKGGFGSHITPTFNYSLKPEMVTEMFAELRLPIAEIEQGWLRTAIMSSVNDVSNRWEVDEIFADREKFENAIIAECNKRVGKWFNVSLLRTNIVPPPSLQKAIEAKTKAIQEAEAKEQEALVAIADGKKKIAVAQADSAQRVIDAAGHASATLIKANAEAEAIRIKQREITPNYNKYLWNKAWDGVLPTTMAGDGGGILLDVRK
jgi:hypothetical protein